MRRFEEKLYMRGLLSRDQLREYPTSQLRTTVMESTKVDTNTMHSVALISQSMSAEF